MLVRSGGVHVIQTFVSEDISEEVQIKGRTARQDNKGSFGMVLLEAMDCGVPIVASRNSAIVEVMGSEYPFLFETGNPGELAVAMELAISYDRKTLLSYYKDRLESFSVRNLSTSMDAIYRLADQ
jgi:glycosyltransferase involved in cell wall biosynthesis